MHEPNRDLVRRDSPAALSADLSGAPQVEILSRPPGPRTVRTPLRRSARFRVFGLVFLLVLGAGSVWNFTRPAIYRASATILVEAPQGVGDHAGEEGADAQNVAVQGRVLLAQDLLEETLTLAGQEPGPPLELDADGLRRLLHVQATPGTNLVELSATGADPEQLAVLVNAWTDAYLARRQRQVASDVDRTLGRLQEEYDRLADAKRDQAAALDAYRERHDIDTMERDGNQALARLDALTKALNEARAEHLKAQAHQGALDEAIARGEPVLPQSEKAEVGQLQAEAAKLRLRLANLQKRFTPVYLENEPNLRELPEQLSDLETRIESKLKEGRDFLRSQASRDVARTERQIQVQEQQIKVARSEASRFTARFAKYETLKEDLEAVDKLHRDLEAQLVQVKAKAPQRYAQVKVVEPAFAPRFPFDPNYGRDFLYTLGAAAGSALLAILLFEFLTRRTREDDELAPVTGVRVFAPQGDAPRGLEPSPVPTGLHYQEPAPRLQGMAAPEPLGLPGSIQRELLTAEVQALMELADPATRQLIGFLLSGLSLDECADLCESDLDLTAEGLRVPGDGRDVTLGPRLVRDLAEHNPKPLWSGALGSAGVEGLGARIGLLAHDAGLSHPAEVGVGALRHSYICYLVRQGARLTEIERVIGALPAAELARYGVYRAAGPARPLADLNLVYPALATAS